MKTTREKPAKPAKRADAGDSGVKMPLHVFVAVMWARVLPPEPTRLLVKRETTAGTAPRPSNFVVRLGGDDAVARPAVPWSFEPAAPHLRWAHDYGDRPIGFFAPMLKACGLREIAPASSGSGERHKG